MQRRISISTIFLFLFFVTSISADETILPDPAKLSQNWWSYFEAPADQIADRIADFEAMVKNSTAVIDETSKSQIEKMHLDLHSYVEATQLKAPSQFLTNPIASSYSLDHVLDLNREARKKNIELLTYKSDREEKLRKIEESQACLDRFLLNYDKTETRSEEKFLLGINIIGCKAGIESAKRNLDYLNQIIQRESVAADKIKEELQAALNRIAINDLDLKKLRGQVTTSEAAWNQKRKELQAKENSAEMAISGNQGEKREKEFQKHDQMFLNVSILESMAHHEYVFSQLALTLAKLILEPHKLDLSSLVSSSSEWKSIFQSQLAKNSDWSELLKKESQRYGQLLTLNAETEEASLERQLFKETENNLLLIQSLQNQLSDNEFLLGEIDNRISHMIGDKERWFLDQMEVVKKSYAQASDWFNIPLFHFGTNPVTLSNLLTFLIIMLIAMWVSRMMARALNSFSLHRHKSAIYPVTRLAQYLVLGVGLILALTAMGFDFSNLLLVAGALGVGLGFGLQSIFNNFVSGIIILFESQLKVGDYIELGSEVKGEVREINVRSTIIATSDGSEVIVPNSEMISNKVINWTMNDPYRRIHIPFSVAYGSDKNKVAQVVIEAAKNVPRTLKKPGVDDPAVFLKALGDTGMEFELAVWVDEKSSTNVLPSTSDYLWTIEDALLKHKIAIPVPQHEIKLITCS